MSVPLAVFLAIFSHMRFADLIAVSNACVSTRLIPCFSKVYYWARTFFVGEYIRNYFPVAFPVLPLLVPTPN